MCRTLFRLTLFYPIIVSFHKIITAIYLKFFLIIASLSCVLHVCDGLNQPYLVNTNVFEIGFMSYIWYHITIRKLPKKRFNILNKRSILR